MSSTYSSDLRLQLMGPGDQAGTWGSTTNNNFQYILEQAIAGVQTVNISSTPYALTYLNGATSTLANNQAIAAALIFTGGVSGGYTVTTPSGASKIYVVFNNTSYVLTLQVTGSSGSTVAIPAGTTTTVYTDGTNFYAGSTGTISGFTVGGALTVAGGLSVAGTTALAGTLSVNGATAHTGAVALNGGGTSVTPSTGDNSTKIATTAFVQSSALALSTIYPVGSIYMNTSSGTNPTTLFGFGTWAALAPGQMLLGNGGGYTAGNTGGSATTTLSTSNLPSHSHSASSTDSGHTHTFTEYGSFAPQSGSSTPVWYGTSTANTGTGFANITTTIGNTGSGTAFSTISPYLVVYMWQRTA